MDFTQDAVFWPQLLSRSGYRTFFTGKWHNARRPWDVGFNCGASIYIGGGGDHRAIRMRSWNDESEERIADKFSSTEFADAAIDFLSQQEVDQPFCAFVSFTAPHDPWIPPDAFRELYSPENIRVPINFQTRPSFTIPDTFSELRDQRVLPFPRTERDVREATALYYGMISHLDEEIGRVLDVLEARGLAGKTLVIFAGDHGYSLGSHGFVGKQTMYEEGIRLPLIVRVPGILRDAAVCSELVSVADFFATICDAAQVQAPDQIEGRSLLSLYRGEAAGWRDRIFASHHSPQKHRMSSRCVRTRAHKLIHHDLTGENELFDLQRDPHELVNLDGRKEVESEQAELSAALQNWWTECQRNSVRHTNQVEDE